MTYGKLLNYTFVKLPDIYHHLLRNNIVVFIKIVFSFVLISSYNYL